MHLMLEGLGKHILTYTAVILKSTGKIFSFRWIQINAVFFCIYLSFFLLHLGHLNVIDSYIINLPRRSSALPRSLKKVSVGLSGLATFNAMDLPGLLLQVGLALGCHNSARLPGQVVKGIQRCIYFFLRLQRCRLREEHSEITVQALPKTVFYHH